MKVSEEVTDEKIAENMDLDSTGLSTTSIFSNIFSREMGSSLSSPTLNIGKNSVSIG